MADPVSNAISGMIGVVGTGISTGIEWEAAQTKAQGERDLAQGQYNMYMYKAGIDRFNEKVAYDNANYAIQVGEQRQQQSGMKTAYQVGETMVTQSASGIDVNTGSAEALRQSEQEVGLFEQNVIRADAAKTAYNFDIQAQTAEMQAQLDTMAGEQAKKAGDIAAETTMLGAKASIASQWTRALQGIVGGGGGGGGRDSPHPE